MSTDYTVNGKHTAVGHQVHFTGSDGKKHNAKITHLHNTDGTANLEATVDGQLRQFTSVPHNPNASSYSWNHVD